MPERAAWQGGGCDCQLVNAAMVSVRDCHGQRKRYIQPKRHPCDHEQPFLYRASNVLLFSSSNQMPGARFNFCVQICSDFTSDAFVRDLRRECAQRLLSPLDFTFVLQLNLDQEATQFKNSVRAYFSAPDEMIETNLGCLLFANNANSAHGRSREWGRSKLHFRYEERFRPLEAPRPTFWLQDERAHDHQAVVLREPGPGLYWLQYKPRYLVNTMPGAGQAGPFPNEHALFARIEAGRIQDAAPTTLFRPLPAICHWLESEWRDGRQGLQSMLQEKHATPEVIQFCIERYDGAVSDWTDALMPGDDNAMRLVKLLFSCFHEQQYPPRQPEPELWCDETCNGAKRMISAYSLFRIATEARGPARPDIAPTHHALLGETTTITLLWGADRASVDRMISIHLQQLDAYGAGDWRWNEHVLILINPQGTMGADELREVVARVTDQVHVGSPPGNAGTHLRQGGEAVSGRASLRIRCLFAADLYGAVSGDTPIEVSRRLQGVATRGLYAQ
jgi:hypothetical protein